MMRGARTARRGLFAMIVIGLGEMALGARGDRRAGFADRRICQHRRRIVAGDAGLRSASRGR